MGGGKATCFVFEDGEDLVLYPFLMNPISPLGYDLPYECYDIQGAYGYNGILTSSDDPAFITAFHEAFDAFCLDRRIVAEFTRFHPVLNNQLLASPKMRMYFSRNTVKLDLSQTLEDIWQHSFSPKNRNVIKKAEKEGVTIVESDDYREFSRLYDRTMQDVGAEDFYFFPPAYYSDFQEMLKKNLTLCFAMYQDTPIAGSMFMFFGDYAHYHLSGRDRNYHKLAANNAVLWYAIKKAKEMGCKWFHFGGGTTGEPSDPLLHFKRNFSKESGEFWYGKRVHDPVVYDRIVDQWKACYPESYQKNCVKLLGYREINH